MLPVLISIPSPQTADAEFAGNVSALCRETCSGSSTCTGTISCAARSSPASSSRSCLCQRMKVEYLTPLVSLLFQVLIFVSHFSAPVVRLMRLLRFLRLPALLRLLRPLISFVSFSYSLTSSAALLDGGLWGGYPVWSDRRRPCSLVRLPCRTLEQFQEIV